MAVTREQIPIKGFEELQRQLKTLPPKVRDKVLAQTMRKGANEIKTAAVGKAPIGKAKKFMRWGKRAARVRNPGTLRASIVAKEMLDDLKAIHFIAGVQRGKKRGQNAYYAHMVEWGHKIVLTCGPKRVRREIGAVGEKPFLRPAADEGIPRLMRMVESDLRSKVERLAKSYA